MYQSKFRELGNINIFTSEEKILIKKFIEFDEKCFHQIDLNNQKIYWADSWKLKVDYLQNINNLLEFICNLYNVFNKHKIIFIKRGFKFYRFIDFFFNWGKISIFYDSICKEYFSSLDKELKSMYKNKPEKFFEFVKKINKINKIVEKNFLKNIEDFKKIKYKIKKI